MKQTLRPVYEYQSVHSQKQSSNLGILLDTKLSWNGRVTANKAKALKKSIGRLAGLAESVWGAMRRRMRQMLQSVVVPQLTNACLVWYTLHGEKRHNKTHLKHLMSIQYQANRVIIGAYKATSTPALDIETHTISIKQKLDWPASNTASPRVTKESPKY